MGGGWRADECKKRNDVGREVQGSYYFSSARMLPYLWWPDFALLCLQHSVTVKRNELVSCDPVKLSWLAYMLLLDYNLLVFILKIFKFLKQPKEK